MLQYTHQSIAPRPQGGPVLHSSPPLLAAPLQRVATSVPGGQQKEWSREGHHPGLCLTPPAAHLVGNPSPLHHREQSPQTRHQRTPVGVQCSIVQQRNTLLNLRPTILSLRNISCQAWPLATLMAVTITNQLGKHPYNTRRGLSNPKLSERAWCVMI